MGRTNEFWKNVFLKRINIGSHDTVLKSLIGINESHIKPNFWQIGWILDCFLVYKQRHRPCSGNILCGYSWQNFSIKIWIFRSCYSKFCHFHEILLKLSNRYMFAYLGKTNYTVQIISRKKSRTIFWFKLI